jgi:hypothetical protein
MAFEWRDFLEIARFLEAQAVGRSIPPEAAYRTALGRAYYAAYGHAHQYASAWLGFRGKTKAEEKSQEHGALRAHLKSRRRNLVAEKLDSLRTSRNRCDYDDDVADLDLPALVRLALQAAEYVIQALPPPTSP